MTPGGWLRERGDSRFDGCAQLLAHRIGGGMLIVGVGVVHRGGRDIGHGQVPDLGDLEAGARAAGPWCARRRPLSTRCCRSCTSAWFAGGLPVGRAPTSRWWLVTLDGRRRRVVVGASRTTQGLPSQQQENDAQEQQHHHHGPQRKPGGVGDALFHRAHCSQKRAGTCKGTSGVRSPRSRGGAPHGPSAGWRAAVAIASPASGRRPAPRAGRPAR